MLFEQSYIFSQISFLGTKNAFLLANFVVPVTLSPVMLFNWKKWDKYLPFLDHKEDDAPLKSQKSSGISRVHFFSDLFVGRSFHGLCSSTSLVTLMQARKERQHFGVLCRKASLGCLLAYVLFVP